MSSTTFLHFNNGKEFVVEGKADIDVTGTVYTTIDMRADYKESLHLFLTREQMIETRKAIDDALQAEEKLVLEQKAAKEQEPNDTSDIECITEDDIVYDAPF